MECDNIWEQIVELLRLPGILRSKGFFEPAIILPFSGYNGAKTVNDPDKDAEEFGNPKLTDLMPVDKKSTWDELVQYVKNKNSIENSNKIKQKD